MASPGNRKPTETPFQSNKPQAQPASESDSATAEVVSMSDIEIFERTQLDMQIATAKRWRRPTDLNVIVDEMISFATLDEETAASCFYTYEHEEDNGKKTMEYGPSIRLAEIAVVCYQNLRVGARVVSNNGIMIQSQGFCFDLERNVASAVAADRQIASEIWENNKKTGKYRTWSIDMQMKTGNAANSFAYRNNVFKIIPGILIKPVLTACKKKAAGEGPIEVRFTEAVKSFRPFGITEGQLRTYIGKKDVPVKQLEDEDIVALRGLFTNIRDGVSTVFDLFGKIDKDGTDHRNDPVVEPKQEGLRETPRGAVAETMAQGLPTPELPLETVGPFTPNKLSPSQVNRLMELFTKNGHGKTAAQLTQRLATWKGSLDELIYELEQPVAK